MPTFVSFISIAEMDLGKDAASDKNKEYVQQAEPKGKVVSDFLYINIFKVTMHNHFSLI